MKLKYRVWDKKDKRWVVNVQVDFSGVLWWQYGDSLRVIDNPERYDVQLFTHLLDKNEKEIYEGDIVLLEDSYKHIITDDGAGPTEPANHCAPVSFENYSWGATVPKDDGADWYDPGFHSFDEINETTGLETLEVIGNIYENPDLLKP